MNLLQTPDHGDDIEEKGSETDNEDAEIRREEKGKMPIHLQENIYSLTARLSDRGGPDILVRFAKNDHVRVIARRILENAGVSWTRLYWTGWNYANWWGFCFC